MHPTFCRIAALLLSVPAMVHANGSVALIDIKGPIGPATSGYFEKAQQQAVDSGAEAIVLQIDTPGGLDSAMREIIQTILNSPLPVLAYVAPGGARAASAGTYILYASHVAAMSPATNLGAATPIPVAGSFPSPDKLKDKSEGAEGGETEKAEPTAAPADAGQKKVINDAVAYIRSLAEKRGRNADWAEQAVREGVSLSASEALRLKVVDLLADDVSDLLQQVDGKKYSTTAGEVTLSTATATVVPIKPDWRMRFLAVITNPTVAYILMLIGIYGLLLEGYNPGAILPGVVGSICLLLALYAFQVLPVNYVGLGLILLGVVLIIAEALVPSFGALGFGGIAAFVFGSVLLMDMGVPGYAVNLGVIVGFAIGGAGLIALTVYLLWRSRQAPVVTGDQTLIGHVAVVDEAVASEGWAFVAGERWKIRTPAALPAGARATVVAMEGLTLIVEPEQPKGE